MNAGPVREVSLLADQFLRQSLGDHPEFNLRPQRAELLLSSIRSN